MKCNNICKLTLAVTLVTIVWLALIERADASDWTCNISESQRSVLEFSYSYGREFGVGHTLAAIAMQESRLGNVNISVSDPSASAFHITLDKYVRYQGWQDTPYNRNRAAHDLMYDWFAGAHLATEEILYWKGRHSNLTGHDYWRAAWASYNTGNNWMGSMGQQYADNINNHIQHIRECGWLSHIEQGDD